MGRIKSICFVEFQNEDEASKARSETYDVQWPLNTGGRVKSSFCTVNLHDVHVHVIVFVNEHVSWRGLVCAGRCRC